MGLEVTVIRDAAPAETFFLLDNNGDVLRDHNDNNLEFTPPVT